jgi:hypothetical protein
MLICKCAGKVLQSFSHAVRIVMRFCSYAVMQSCSYVVVQLCSLAVMQSGRPHRGQISITVGDNPRNLSIIKPTT